MSDGEVKEELSFSLDDCKMVEEYTRLKCLGTDCFKAKHFAEAIAYYDEACSAIRSGTGGNTAKMHPTWQGNYVICKSNAAQCYINMKNFNQSIKYCNEALVEDPTNIKSLYRRGLSKENVGDLIGAIEDFYSCLLLEKDNKHIESEFRKLFERIEEVLLSAAKIGDLKPFISIVKCKAFDPNRLLTLRLPKSSSVECLLKRDKTYYLHIASEHGQKDVVEFLLQNGAKVDEREEGNVSALMLASENGHEAVVDTLLEAGAEVNLTTEGKVRIASGFGLDAGEGMVPMIQTVVGGFSALLYAAQAGHYKIVEKLLLRGAKVGQRSVTYEGEELNNKAKFEGSCSAIMFASILGRADLVELLLSHGASLNDKTIKDISMDFTMEMFGLSKEPEHPIGLTCIMLAAKHGHENVVKLLLSKGASVKDQDTHGNTALYYALRNRHNSCIDLLLYFGSNPNIFAKQASPGRVTALHLAIGAFPTVMYQLLDQGADRTLSDHQRVPSLAEIARQTDKRVCEILTEKVGKLWKMFGIKDIIQKYYPYVPHGRGLVPESMRKESVYLANQSVAQDRRLNSELSTTRYKISDYQITGQPFEKFGLQLTGVNKYQTPPLAYDPFTVHPQVIYQIYNACVEFNGILTKGARSIPVNVKIYKDDLQHVKLVYQQESTILSAIPDHGRYHIFPLLGAFEEGNYRAVVTSLQRYITLERYYSEIKSEDMFPTRFEKTEDGNIKSTNFPPNTRIEDRGIIPFAAAKSILSKIALGILHMHSNKVVHLDIKSSNILIDCSTCGATHIGPYPDSIMPYISNFESASLIKSESMRGLVECRGTNKRGTVPFMAPEVLEERANCDLTKIDMYAFGMLIYELLKGDKPFFSLYKFPSDHPNLKDDSSDPSYHNGISLWNDEVRKNVLAGKRPAIEPRWDKTLVLIMTSCWNPDPEQRPSALQAYTALLAVSDKEEETAHLSQFADNPDNTDEIREEIYSFLKILATELFKDNLFETSGKIFLKAFKFVSEKGMKEIAREKFRGFAIICLGNAAQCAINSGKHQNAIDYATKALSFDPMNVKSLYRRGVSYLALKQR